MAWPGHCEVSMMRFRGGESLLPTWTCSLEGPGCKTRILLAVSAECTVLQSCIISSFFDNQVPFRNPAAAQYHIRQQGSPPNSAITSIKRIKVFDITNRIHRYSIPDNTRNLVCMHACICIIAPDSEPRNVLHSHQCKSRKQDAIIGLQWKDFPIYLSICIWYVQVY
jgi:hypothetical protein